MSGPWPNGGVISALAARMAMDHINIRDDILGEYELMMTIDDTGCSMRTSINVLYRRLYEPNITYPLIFGPTCSDASIPVADASTPWGIMHFSYESSSPRLSDKSRFFLL